MNAMPIDPRRWWASHWFFPVAALVTLGDLGSVWFGGWADDGRLLEAALLFDFVVLLPLLYWWCYRARGKKAVVQAVALACFAIWATGKAVPAEHRHLLDSLGWLRWLGLGGLLVLEIRLTIAAYRAVVFSGRSRGEAQQTLESQGLPPWLARFVAWEASLWRRAWLFLRRWLGR
jgi:hypothetical protein